MKTPHVLAISSYAVHGTASLKTFTATLGEKILPVPTLMLNGLTNMSLIRKFEPPFEELLQSSFELAEARGLELILYIGYLGKASQADIISSMIEKYQPLIQTIIVDPVCGDHGRVYVPAEVVEQWPRLIGLADMAFPNLTELKLLTGHPADETGMADDYARQFTERYPNTKLILTSVSDTESTGIKAFGDEPYIYQHPLLSKNYGGSGDAFLSRFILEHFYNGLAFNGALRAAADHVYSLISYSIKQQSDDLILQIPLTQL